MKKKKHKEPEPETIVPEVIQENTLPSLPQLKHLPPEKINEAVVKANELSGSFGKIVAEGVQDLLSGKVGIQDLFKDVFGKLSAEENRIKEEKLKALKDGNTSNPE
jgi:hypothetical protein